MKVYNLDCKLNEIILSLNDKLKIEREGYVDPTSSWITNLLVNVDGLYSLIPFPFLSPSLSHQITTLPHT